MVAQRAFVPHALREGPPLTQATWSVVVQAAVELGRLGGMARDLPVEPSILAGLTVRREALSTSALEGTYAPLADVLVGEVLPRSARTVAVTEVLNFVQAAEYGTERLGELPVCVRLARELHEILVSGTPSEDWQKGRVRETQVVIEPGSGVAATDRVAKARFVPTPPGAALLDGLRDWERWVHDPAAPHPLVRIAVSHYWFEALHPFTDGNGRIGRLLAVLQLIEAGILPAPVVNLSSYFEVRRETYLGLLEKVSLQGAWDEWIVFFCEALASQASESAQRIRDLLGWRERTIALLQAESVRGIALNIVEGLIGHPMVTARSVVERHGVSASTAHQALRRLGESGVLAEMTGGRYGKVYAAHEVMSLLSRPSA
ncbi:MAG: Fic family protein [bacterium]|nr:Fic family protein [bacterium]